MSGHAFEKISGLRWSLGGLWYQFITTGPEITTYSGEIRTVFNGSAVAVKLPKIQADGSVIWDDITPIATGSTLEVLPDSEDDPSTDINQISRVKPPIQIQLLTERVYRGFSSLEREKSYTQTMYSVASTPGMIYNAGVFMLSPYFGEGGYSIDKEYDLPPTSIRGDRAEWRSPNTDWPHDAMRVTTTSEEFGSRRFVVLVDASQHFYCWPDQYDSDDYLEAPYAFQGQIINVPDSQVQSLIPPFPEWVHIPEGYRRDTDWPFMTNSGEPRYVWKFHPQGTKVVGMVLKRTEFSATVYGRTLTTYTYRPFREVVIGDLEFDADKRDGMYIDYKGPLKNDWPGYVEFSIDIQITGINKEDFIFGMTVISEQQADATHYPIAADYLSPVFNGWSSYNIDASPGDLVVLNLECYMDARGRTWVDRHCGYLDVANNYIRQSFLRVYKVGNETTLLSFVTKDWPEDYSIKKWRLDAPELTTYQGKLNSIDLSKLSFVHEVEKRRLSVDTDSPYFSDSIKNAHQTWYESEIGVRYYVFGKKVYQESHGENLNLWDTLDAISEVGSLYNSQELNTRWLYSKNTNTSKSYHWLVNDLKNVYTFVTKLGGGERSTYFVDYDKLYNTDVRVVNFTVDAYVEYLTPTDVYNIRNNFLASMKNLSSVLTGDSYEICKLTPNSTQIILGTPSFTATTYRIEDFRTSPPTYTFIKSSDNFPIYAGDNTPNISYLTKETGLLNELSQGCSSITASYFDDVFVSWCQEIIEDYLIHINTQVNVTSTPYSTVFRPEAWAATDENNQTIYTTETLEIIALSGTSTFYYYDTIWQLDENFIHTGNSVADNFASTPNEGYSLSSQHTIDPVPYFNATIPKFHISSNFALTTDLALTTFNNNHIHQRIYDYPVGCEAMLREWKNAFGEWTFKALLSCSEGFYAGCLMHVHYTTNKIPHYTLYSEKDYIKEFYGSTLKNALHSTVNQPTTSQFNFFTVDLIGHVNNEINLSHLGLYQTAFNVTLSIPNPSVTVTIENDNAEANYKEYLYLKSVTVDSNTNWFYFDETVTNIIYRPILNGSALFSK